jgi:hypothetical protein
MKSGMIPPEKRLRYLQMNETNRLYEELQVDSKQAQRENFQMANTPEPEPQIDPNTGMPALDPATGQPVEPTAEPIYPNSYDNDQVHIYEHSLFMKSQEYEALSPFNKAIFEQHLALTKQKVVNASVGLQQQPGNAGPDNSPVPTNGQSATPGQYAGAAAG